MNCLKYNPAFGNVYGTPILHRRGNLICVDLNLPREIPLTAYITPEYFLERSLTMAPAPLLQTSAPAPPSFPQKAFMNVAEDYDGQYRFAPIQESQVSRAMIKR